MILFRILFNNLLIIRYGNKKEKVIYSQVHLLSDNRQTLLDGIHMDAIETMNEISLRAKENGMSLTEYLRTYDSAGLDNVQSIIKQGLSENQKNIDGFRQNNNIRREQIDFTGMDALSLDLMQAKVNGELNEIRADYTEMQISSMVNKEAVLV